MRNLTIILVAALVVLPGCGWFGGDAKSDKSEAVDAETLKKAIQTAKNIKKDPTKAEAILKEAGYSRSEFEELMYKIALDDVAAEKYAKALREGK
jgi:hypothetical protein